MDEGQQQAHDLTKLISNYKTAEPAAFATALIINLAVLGISTGAPRDSFADFVCERIKELYVNLGK